MVAAVSRAASLGCTNNRCGLLTDGEYHNLIIGRLVHVGSPSETKRVLHWAKTHGYWKSLPNTASPYVKDIKLVRIALPRSLAKHPVTVFIQAEEYHTDPLPVGALVRYSPHGERHEAPPKADADELSLYHGLTGCVASLCKPGDSACSKRYRQGVFTKKTGAPVDPTTGKILPEGHRIDPVSLLPVRQDK